MDRYDFSGFAAVTEEIPDIMIEPRYYSSYNFVGTRIEGYEAPVMLLTKEALAALKLVSAEAIANGYRLKIYDAYRPQRAVRHFERWAKNPRDNLMKEYFYPDIDKSKLFAAGYIILKSGHSRGSTLDLTLFDMKLGKEVDMGGPFDFFGSKSHSYWCGNPQTQLYTGNYWGDTEPHNGEINERQFKNRMILRQLMVKNGFAAIKEEWWHFTLQNEPYPDVYFDFPISISR